jgi:hypothetical protein
VAAVGADVDARVENASAALGNLAYLQGGRDAALSAGVPRLLCAALRGAASLRRRRRCHPRLMAAG